jgi:hypothetical protein
MKIEIPKVQRVMNLPEKYSRKPSGNASTIRAQSAESNAVNQMNNTRVGQKKLTDQSNKEALCSEDDQAGWIS